MTRPGGMGIIGPGDSAANQYWAGGIAHVAIFAGALSATQIGTLMTTADNSGWY